MAEPGARPLTGSAPGALDAWRLPGLREPPAGGWHEGATPAGAPIRAPRLSAGEAGRIADAVRSAALAARGERDAAAVVRVASEAAGRLADPATPAGAEAIVLLRRELGWSERLARETLGGMAVGWSRRALDQVLAAELGDPGVLDRFVAAGPVPLPPAGFPEAEGAARRRRRAAGPPLLFQVLAGNVPGVAVTAIVRGLLVRSGVLVKLPADEPGLALLFCRELAGLDPLLAGTVAATWWPGEEPSPALATWAGRSGKVVVYGGEPAVAAVRGATPAETEIVPYGPRIGVAVVFARGLSAEDADRIAARLARDVCAYETAGCVSPRLVFVVGEAGAEPPGWELASRLGAALEAEVRRLEPPPPGSGEAAAIRGVRAATEMAGYLPAERGARGATAAALGAADLSWTVLTSEPPSLAAETLPRCVRLGRTASVPSLERLLEPLADRVQAIGYAGGDAATVAALAEAAVRLGVSRVAPIGRMAWPPADWRHDGRHQLLPLLRWTEWEEG